MTAGNIEAHAHRVCGGMDPFVSPGPGVSGAPLCFLMHIPVNHLRHENKRMLFRNRQGRVYAWMLTSRSFLGKPRAFLGDARIERSVWGTLLSSPSEKWETRGSGGSIRKSIRTTFDGKGSNVTNSDKSFLFKRLYFIISKGD